MKIILTVCSGPKVVTPRTTGPSPSLLPCSQTHHLRVGPWPPLSWAAGPRPGTGSTRYKGLHSGASARVATPRGVVTRAEINQVRASTSCGASTSLSASTLESVSLSDCLSGVLDEIWYHAILPTPLAPAADSIDWLNNLLI